MRIVVPLDGSTTAEYALGPAATLARAQSEAGSVALIRVVRGVVFPFQSELANPMEAAIEASQDYLREITLRPSLEGLKVEHYVITSGTSVAKGLHEFSQRHQADFVVMSSRGRSGLAQTLLGSGTRRARAGAYWCRSMALARRKQSSRRLCAWRDPSTGPCICCACCGRPMRGVSRNATRCKWRKNTWRTCIV